MLPLQANLESVVVDQSAGLKLDREGGTQAGGDNKTRLISTATSLAVAGMLFAPDRLSPGEPAIKDAQVRTAGGATALGIAGAVAGFVIKSKNVSLTLGTYGLATSVYSNLLGKGRDVTFPKHTALEFGFPRSN